MTRALLSVLADLWGALWWGVAAAVLLVVLSTRQRRRNGLLELFTVTADVERGRVILTCRCGLSIGVLRAGITLPALVAIADEHLARRDGYGVCR